MPILTMRMCAAHDSYHSHVPSAADYIGSTMVANINSANLINTADTSLLALLRGTSVESGPSTTVRTIESYHTCA